MRRHSIYRSIPTVVMTGALALQTGGSLGIAHTLAPSATKARTFKGPIIQTRHGPVGASITVKNRKIVKAGATIAPNEDGRSPFLQQQAVPVLKAEALKAQSAHIDIVSGATETSEAYMQSLDSAIKKARKAKALK